MNPAPWTPPPHHVRELQALVQRLSPLIQMEGQEQNRMDTVEALIHDHIDRHPDLKEQSELLESMPRHWPHLLD